MSAAGRLRHLGVWTAAAFALTLCTAALHGAPSGTKSPRGVTGTRPAPGKNRTRPAPPGSSKTPLELAKEGRALEELGAYVQAADMLRLLRGRVALDGDLEIAIALDEARVGRLDSAWVRLNGPVLNAGLVDTLPVSRRTDYPWEREGLWINGGYNGWHWYIARARAEVAAALGRWEDAREAARMAVAARPLVGREWLILAVCSGRAGDLERAAAAASQAAYLDRSLPEAQYLQGLYEWRAGHRSAAQSRFRAAIALDSSYREPALALMRSRLPGAAADTLPTAFLTGVREIGLLTSPARPKLEEFVQMDRTASMIRLIEPTVPDSLRGTFPDAALSLSLLVDERGRVVMHELPWYEPSRFPGPMVSLLTEGLAEWRLDPAVRFGAPHKSWVVVHLNIKS